MEDKRKYRVKMEDNGAKEDVGVRGRSEEGK